MVFECLDEDLTTISPINFNKRLSLFAWEASADLFFEPDDDFLVVGAGVGTTGVVPAMAEASAAAVAWAIIIASCSFVGWFRYVGVGG